MSTHTPGPWALLMRDETEEMPVIWDGKKDAPMDIAILSSDCESMAEIRANAALIAAAPEMLEALEKLAELQRKWRSDDESETIDSIEYMDELDNILWTDIIAKAKGATK